MQISKHLPCTKKFTPLNFFYSIGGLFYKCYNQDAMVFANRVKPFKVSTKYVKSIGAELLSLGFPASEVDRID